MKSILLISFSVLSFVSFGQVSEFYNEKGQLLVDTNYSVSDANNIPELGSIDDRNLIYSILTRIEFPEVVIDNGIQEVIFLEFEILPSEEHQRSYYTNYVKIVPENNSKYPNTLLYKFKEYLNGRYFVFSKVNKLKEPYKFYIPIKFINENGSDHKVEKYYEDGIIIYKAIIKPFVTRG